MLCGVYMISAGFTVLFYTHGSTIIRIQYYIASLTTFSSSSNQKQIYPLRVDLTSKWFFMLLFWPSLQGYHQDCKQDAKSAAYYLICGFHVLTLEAPLLLSNPQVLLIIPTHTVIMQLVHYLKLVGNGIKCESSIRIGKLGKQIVIQSQIGCLGEIRWRVRISALNTLSIVWFPLCQG